ncbi:phospholipase D domain protein [Natrialba magadii ATCC 43099]|uniref:Phospholipase D domain protein n=1 Tax=Natrialba magadii (strain ATCC 43099 / DSM 3394 / CCM 3739 / CIP 104546 / IAM 13178 / JCM 8861 / NBRC 102185 / NCIMB 2190 / MS3) TaxID=547559 RepID=D3SXN9_NATMM|nr:phospholipase D-like domain-containing protein [Natrialba magadii]ADD05988.1 phospholipase D domain protein [Natrialba magadii ATCC 43099]ELY30503.1 phospholipase-like protein [Natrialba magadii ATCC 43099]
MSGSSGRAIALCALLACSLLSGLTVGIWGVAAATPLSVSSAGPSGSPPMSTPADSVTCPVDHRSPTTQDATQPRLVEVAPNPTTDQNVGEFVVLETPPKTHVGNWTLTDGHTTAPLPNETVSGRTALSTAPNATTDLTDDPVIELEGSIRFAADGDVLELRNGSTTVDTVEYDRAPLAQRWYRGSTADSDTDIAADANASVTAGTADSTEPADTNGQWWPHDATCVPPTNSKVSTATAFVLPDEPAVPLETIRSAEDRLLLAGYTITSSEIADELVAAAERGVEVAVLIEASPVGGTPAASEPVLESLLESDVDVGATGGEGARYRFHHPKYAVADDTVLVTTENWGPSGVGGESSRGWGVVLEDPTLAAELADIFEADFDGWDTVSGEAYLADTSFVEDDDGFGADVSPSYPTEHDAEGVSTTSAELLVAPDNAEPRLQTLIADADDEILLKQASIDPSLSLLEETVDAARRGVDVRILLDSTWYHEDDNEALAADLEQLAETEELPIDVRLVDDTDRFEKIHAKGVVIDREVAVVGSANWNENAFENNREVMLALHGSEAAAYYAAVFDTDWEGDSWSLSLGTVVIVLLALAFAALVGRRYIRFGDETERVKPEEKSR